MRVRSSDAYVSIQTVGGLLPAELLEKIAAGDGNLDGLKPSDYHLAENEKISEAITRSWNRLRGAWSAFQKARGLLAEGDAGAGVTREKWLSILFQELGYGRLAPSRAVAVDGREYPISHFWQTVPIHMVGCQTDLDRRSRGVAGAARFSPHSLVQEFLNRSDSHIWAFVTNGVKLRLLRDNLTLTRQAYVEFDLEMMLEGDLYSDFVLVWLICHQSRLESDKPETCVLERWARTAAEQGTRALDKLRGGVETAISELGAGFLAHPANRALKDKLRSGALSKQDYYRQLLRLVYRLIFLFVAEDRDVLHGPNVSADSKGRYFQYYSTQRLRRMAARIRGTRHADLYQGLRLVMNRLGNDAGCPELGLPCLGSFLWDEAAMPDIQNTELPNTYLLSAVRALAESREGGVRRVVNYRNLGAEELGSVYESLLELHPELNVDAAKFELKTAGGHERKSTGSYYTPTSLINCLLDSALDPVVDARTRGKRGDEAEQAILSMKVCDPACGSGHFLIAAAHRLAKRLAAIRTGDDEPSPDATRTALHDVIGRCIYGVDINPMSVELCKVSLWMDAMEPGKPLSFLDHRIQCGNSLLGTTPALMVKGIPDDAFTPMEGDERKTCTELKKRNKNERENAGQMSLTLSRGAGQSAAGSLSDRIRVITEMDDGTIAGRKAKQMAYQEFLSSDAHLIARLRADAWCATFVWKKIQNASEPVTHDLFLKLSESPDQIDPATLDEIRRLADQYQFFHWHLVFPDVFRIPAGETPPDNEQAGWSGGYDVVLGNPPWERIKLQEQEWFAERRPDIANAPNAATRGRMINTLANDDTRLHQEFLDDRRRAEGESHFVRDSKKYPLCGRGDINTYTVFAETMRLLIAPVGRVGAIVPSGIATDDTTKFFFQDLVEKRSLHSLYEFENEGFFGAGRGHMVRFALTTLVGSSLRNDRIDLVFQGKDILELSDDQRHFTLTADELRLINPNTCTCPIFRTRRDAELTKVIYRRVPVLIKEEPEENPWEISFMRMLDMANDSHLFKTASQLESDGQRLEGNVFVKGRERYLPLYEAKMIYQFDHRYGDYGLLAPGERGHVLPDVPVSHIQDATYSPLPRYWVSESEVYSRMQNKWSQSWLIGWRDITDARASARTVIASVVPRVGVGHTMPLMLFESSTAVAVAALVCCLSSFAFDWAARQKIGGLHLTYLYLKQLPVLPPETYERPCGWSKTQTLAAWIKPRALELTYTAWDLAPFAKDCGYDGPPFRWDESRRFLLRCELDAAFFHLYGIARADVDYIMDTFPIVKRKDEAAHGEYRTKRVILEIYDEMAVAMQSGRPYQTRLDPPAADARVGHPRRLSEPTLGKPRPK